MEFQNRIFKLGISAAVFLIVLAITTPFLLDVEPPGIVRVLMLPSTLLASLVRLPCMNIGTPEHPICEGTPIHLLIGLVLFFVGSLFYPAATYLILSLLSKFRSR